MTDLQSFEVRVADLLGVCELLSECSTEIREDMEVCQQGKLIVNGEKRDRGERKNVKNVNKQEHIVRNVEETFQRKMESVHHVKVLTIVPNVQ